MAFKLSPLFLSQYEGEQPNWGFGALSYFVYKRTYARIMKDGKQEEYYDTCRRVTEGVFTIQKKHCHTNRLPWNAYKAQKTAQEFFRRMWEFKFTPPGRGFWIMGTPIVDKIGSAALNNCGFRSTKAIDIDFGAPFSWAMDMLMLGVGVGFDTKGAGKIVIKEPKERVEEYESADSREGWVESVYLKINSYTGCPRYKFTYDKIRKRGEPIKGFGGTASGPEPLKELHDFIDSLLTPLIGQKITSVAITDLFNVIGKCVVAGNVRRSAELAIGNINDLDYMSMKDYELYPDELISHRWASNNSVSAEPYSEFVNVAAGAAKNGEPGLVFISNMNHYGRFKDGFINYESDRYDDAEGTNPCVTANTRLHTNHGMVKVIDLFTSGSKLECTVDNRTLGRKIGTTTRSAVPVFRTSDSADVYKIKTHAGYEISATRWHKFYTNRGKIELEKLKIGDSLFVQSGMGQFGQEGFYDLGLLMGFIAGDGHFTGDKAVISLWGNDKIYTNDVLKTCNSMIGKMPRARTLKGTLITSRDEWRCKSSILAKKLEMYGFNKDTKLQVPEIVWRGTQNMIIGYLNGLFQSDGTVNTSGNNSSQCSVRLSSSHREFLIEIQAILSNFGIFCKIVSRRKAGKRSLPNGRGGSKKYYCRENFELIMDGKGRDVFMSEIGFPHDSLKTEKYNNWSLGKKLYKTQGFTSKIISICKVGKEAVYDTTQDDNNTVIFNGLVTGQCGEQPLEDKELCTLVETYPANHDTVEDYHRTLKFAYMYAKTITLVPTHDEGTNAVMMRNRRIGCSMSGIQQAIKKFGVYKFLHEFCDKGYETIRSWDRIYSRWLGIPRSLRMTTVKPSGSVSILAGATPGIHFTHSEYYMRLVRVAADSPLLLPLFMAGYKIEVAVTDNDKIGIGKKVIFRIDSAEDLQMAADKGVTLVAYFPIKEKNFTKSKFETTLWEQLTMVRELQYYWSDNAVSCTVTLKEEEKSQLCGAIELYAPYVKTLSFMPLVDHKYTQAPYTECTEKEYSDYSSILGGLHLDTVAELNIKGSKFCTTDKCEI